MVDGEECGRARPCLGRDQFLFRSDPAEARRPRLAVAVAVHWVGAGYGVSRYKQVVVMVAVSPIDIKQTVLRNGRPSCSTSSSHRRGSGGRERAREASQSFTGKVRRGCICLRNLRSGTGYVLRIYEVTS